MLSCVFYNTILLFKDFSIHYLYFEKISLFQQSKYRFWRYLHLRDGTHADTHIFHAGTKQIDIIVDNKEPIVVSLWQLNELDFTILFIMLLQVCLEWFIVARVNRSLHIICPFVQERKHAVIHEVVNQYNPLFGTPHQV